jgi:hypothetical protein
VIWGLDRKSRFLGFRAKSRFLLVPPYGVTRRNGKAYSSMTGHRSREFQGDEFGGGAHVHQHAAMGGGEPLDFARL